MREKDSTSHYIKAKMKVTDDVDYTERSIRNITNRINSYKENKMAYKKAEPKPEPKEKKEIIIPVESTEEVIKDVKAGDIVVNPTIG